MQGGTFGRGRCNSIIMRNRGFCNEKGNTVELKIEWKILIGRRKTLQVVTILVTMAPIILKVATLFVKSKNW